MTTDRAQATTRKAGPGKGNHRTGRTKGTAARRGQLPWRDDPLIRRRIELVEELGYQPRSVLLATVNRWLAQQDPPQDPISETTLKADLARAQELAFERIVKGAEARIVDLERVKEAAWRDVNRLKEGDPGRAAFYAAIFRAVVAQAHLDGSWRTAGAPPPPEAPEVGMVGPSPLELLEQGRITRQQYEVHLQVFHLAMGGMVTSTGDAARPARQALPAAPAVTRPLATGGGRAPVTVTADGDLIDGELVEPAEDPEEQRPVVRWQPAEDEAFP